METVCVCVSACRKKISRGILRKGLRLRAEQLATVFSGVMYFVCFVS